MLQRSAQCYFAAGIGSERRLDQEKKVKTEGDGRLLRNLSFFVIWKGSEADFFKTTR